MNIDETLRKDTLKEYYINLQSMYNNAVNMLTAINQSLQTTSTNVLVNIMDNDDTYTTVRIPSFLYLENKLEQLESNFNNLFNMPESGEAWFSLNDSMQKLELVKATTSPLKPTIGNSSDLYVQSTVNNFLKDLVNPKTFIRLQLNNLPNNINDIFVKKIIINDISTFNSLKNQNTASVPLTYERFKQNMMPFFINNDYYEYDIELKTPLKRDRFNSYFRILEIPELTSGNPWIEYEAGSHGHTRYKIRISTMTYYDKDDSSYRFTLKNGDLLCLDNENVIYKIVNTSSTINDLGENECLITVEEQIGHQVLQTTEENSSMILRLYNEDFSDYHYVDVPLEEDPYIIIYIGTIYNNVRSILSDPVFINLNNIEVHDSDNNPILENGNVMDYISYYNKYCNNIGDLISGLSETIYPQLSNYSSTEMFNMTDGDVVRELVTKSIDLNGGLQVVKINAHLTDDDAINDIKKWHEEKNRITNDLTNVQNSIDKIYNQLLTTDFKSDTTVTQFELQEKLTKYYNERTLLTSQKINMVENINIYRNDVKNYAKSKFRIRGITNPNEIISYIKKTFGDKTDITGIDIRYKYVTATKQTSNNVNINSTVFTDWIKQPSIERQRKLIYNNNTSSYYIDYVNYNDMSNPIKWNQIDIPIMQGEDVILQIRYKLNIGQPFINLYTPWSDEFTQEFPNEMKEITELSSIIQNNENDTVYALFNKTLINDGYTKHIADTLIDNAREYLHSADKINSGFLNSSNNLMSLKEKLDIIDSEVLKYRTLIEREINSTFEVYVSYEGNLMEIYPNVTNEIPVFIAKSTNNSFVKKNINIIIKNNGEIPITFMTMFPGSTDVNIRDYANDIAFSSDDHKHYDNVLLTYGNSNEPSNSIFEQTLGQWLYFRNDHPSTYQKLYSSNTSSNDNIIPSNQVMFNEEDVEDNLDIIVNDNEILINELSNNKNSNENNIYSNYIVLYEHMTNSNNSHWSEGTSSEGFDALNSVSHSIFVPNLKTMNDLLCDTDKTDQSQKKKIDPMQTLTIPLIFEYYLETNTDDTSNNVESSNSSNIKTLSNTIAFTFRPSRLATPVTYILKASAEN